MTDSKVVADSCGICENNARVHRKLPVDSNTSTLHNTYIHKVKKYIKFSKLCAQRESK